MISSPSTPQLPQRIEGLAGIAANLLWSWRQDARALFRTIEPSLWRQTRHNPIEVLQRVDPARLHACASDPEFLRRYDALRDSFSRALDGAETWFARTYPGLVSRPAAYFCAEFGLHNSVPIYSGGLGVLAGDHCKAASDLGVPLVGVGLYYRQGYFDQRLAPDGRQEAAGERFDAAATPLVPVLASNGAPHLAIVRSCGRPVHVGAWRVMVGRVPVFLLDTSIEQNDPEDRQLSSQLYAGGPDLRLRQEWILGVGGVRVLRALGIDPAVWHANEGHAAFMLLERLRERVTAGMPFAEALRHVRATTVFTTHTPVPAGHDVFSAEQLERCTGPVWEELGISRDALLALGRHAETHDAFHMTAMAIRLSGRVNGVAERHGHVTRRMWQSLWPGRPPERVPIAHVTNGVHVATWMSYWVRALLDEQLGPDWERRIDEPGLWDRVLQLDDAKLWTARLRLKAQLMDFIREEARWRWREQWGGGDDHHFAGAGSLLTSAALTIGFARRFATYKRADLMFRDAERLRRVLVDPRRPVQIIFAGKAHPADEPGKQMLQRIYAFAREPRFEGRIAFLEDYEMHLAHRLVQGVDLWLNVPRLPLEACGTSGMKAALNGVPQLGTLDGWWAEGYDGGNGWAIPAAPEGADADAVDAERLYQVLEGEIVPLFYDRDNGIPAGWVRRMKQAMHVAGRRFTASRMVRQYVTEHYVPAITGQLPGDDAPTG